MQATRMIQKVCAVFCPFILSTGLLACSASNQSSEQAQSNDMRMLEVGTQQMSPEEAQEALNDIGNSWLYGDGLGTAMLNVGTTVLFPPYALFLAGNFALEASGYEALGVGSFLGDESREEWDDAFSTVVSGPGRVAAAVANEEYSSPERTQQRLEKYTQLQNVDGVHGEY